jgi:hypothetical protein
MKMCLRLCRQSVLRSSQPIPPAPTRRARVDEKSILQGEGVGETFGNFRDIDEFSAGLPKKIRADARAVTGGAVSDRGSINRNLD